MFWEENSVNLHVSQYVLFPLVEHSKIKASQVGHLGQLVFRLVHMNIFAYLRKLSSFGKFDIEILFVFSVDRCAVNCNTYSNLIYLEIFIYLY